VVPNFFLSRLILAPGDIIPISNVIAQARLKAILVVNATFRADCVAMGLYGDGAVD
jgi:hypothetical protein